MTIREIGPLEPRLQVMTKQSALLVVNEHGFCALVEALDQYVENCHDGIDTEEDYAGFPYLKDAEKMLDFLNGQRASMATGHAVTTTSGDTFSFGESRALAYLVWRRFGCNIEAAAAAWRRLLQNSATESDFQELVNG